MSKRFSRFVSIVLTLCVFLSLLPIRELRADLNTHGEYSVPPFEVTYTQNASWDTTTQGAFNVENVSEEAVSSWSFEIEYLYPVTVSNIYGASLVNYFGVPTNTITVVNEVSNGNIAAGSSTSFGLMLVGEAEAPIAPVSVRLISDNTDTPVIEPTDSVFPYAIFSGSNTSDLTFNGWRSEVVGDVYTGSNYVYNGSELTLNGTVRAVGSITSPGWNINITNQVENAAVENMPDWGNSILARGNELPAIDPIRFTSEDPILTDGYCYIDGDVTISGTTFEGDAIIVASGDITYNINQISGSGRVLLYSENGNITINGTSININGILYAPNGSVTISAYETTVNGRIVSDEFFYSGSILNCYADASDLDMFYPDIEVTVTPTPSEEVTITPTEIPDITDIPEVTVTPSVEPTITPDIDWDTDSDGDGLPDDVEEILGTDKYNEDSDFDGLNDYIEVMIGYNPLSPDTDGNGISDGAEDFDGDGLTNSYELLVGTNPGYSDSDNDDLSDGDEVLVYSTNPLNYDSDSDGISDGEEVLIGKNPLDSSDGDALIIQTIHTDINNSDDAAIISVDITMASRGYLKYSTYVEDLYNIDVYSTDVYGRIGSPIGLNTREEFDTATITIHYDESQLGDAQESNLGVLWFDEESRFYIEQTQAVVDEVANTVTVELSHFSTYVLVDLDKWHNPILPDYSDYMYVAHGEEIGYWALAYVPSLEEVEASAWAWWHLTHDNMVKLATLSSSSEYRGWVVYDFFYDWLVVDSTDRDEDGVPDFLEINGILGTNGKIYYSNPTIFDTDEDGVSDGDEYGSIGGSCLYNGNKYSFSLNSDEVFSNFSFANSNVCVTAKINSDPSKRYTDNDDVVDGMDSYPLITKTDKIYIFYVMNDGVSISDARLMYDTYIQNGLNCELIGFWGGENFIELWGRIGRKYITEDIYTHDDYYNVTDVVVVCHGCFDSVNLGNSDYLVLMESQYYEMANMFYSVQDLPNKSIENLHLIICGAGALDYTDNFDYNDYSTNIASDFLCSLTGIENVYAFDCICHVRHNPDGSYSLLGKTHGRLNLLPIYTTDNNILMDSIGINTHQQCRFSRVASEGMTFFVSIDGYDIFYDDCYLDDWYIEAESITGISYRRFTNNYSYFDPILL